MWALQHSFIIASCLLALLYSATADEDPLVTLKHGGQLQGVSYAVGEQKVDHFVSKFMLQLAVQSPYSLLVCTDQEPVSGLGIITF